MRRRGNCWDNAVAESFFSTLKVELIHDVHFATRAQAETVVREYVERFYNIERQHSALGARLRQPHRVRAHVAGQPTRGIINLSTRIGEAHLEGLG